MLYGVTNVFLYIESLRVVDLLRKGVYNLKVKVYQENDVTNIAKPTIIQAPKTNKDYSHVIKDHEVLNNNCYSSKKFFVQYINEFFLFGNFISFQIELPLYNYYSNNLIVDFELIYYTTEDDSSESIPNYSNNTSIYSQIYQSTSPNSNTSSSSPSSSSSSSSTTTSTTSPNEKLVSQQRIKINKAGYGIHQYIPITFSDLYFCLFKMTISTSLVDIKFRHQSIESLINFSNIKSINDDMNISSSNSSNNSSPNSSSPNTSLSTSPPNINIMKSSSSSPLLNGANIQPTPPNNHSLSFSTLPLASPTITNINNSSNTPPQLGTSPKLLRQKIGRLSLSMSQIQSSPLEEDFLNDFFDYKYPEVLSFFVESYYRLGTKHKFLLSLLKKSQLTLLGDSVTTIPALNIPPFSRTPIYQQHFQQQQQTTTPTSTNTPLPPKKQRPQTQAIPPSLQDYNTDSTIWKVASSSDISNTFKKRSYLRSSVDIGSAASNLIDSESNTTSSTTSSPSSSLNNSTNNLQNLNLNNNSPSTTSQNNIILKWKNILFNFQNLSEQTTKLWNNYVMVFQMVAREYCFRASINYEKKCIDKWGFRIQRIVQYIQSSDDLLLSDSSIPSSCFLSTNPSFFNYKPFKIQHIPLKPDSVYHSMPIFFEHILKIHNETNFGGSNGNGNGNSNGSSNVGNSLSSSSGDSSNNLNGSTYQSSSKHLFVFVHGLSGSSFDLRQFKNYFQLHFPNFLFLMCSSIEENTLEDIEQMGEKIAAELNEYLRDNNLMSFSSICKISFLCHSLGGLVVRSALTCRSLQPHLHKLHSYISLSTPHLGTKFLNGNIVAPAMWIWQKFTNSTCLKQLLMQDAQNLQDCYLYKLSTCKSFEYFQYCFLISSEQDGYVPYHSARIEVPKDSKENSKHIQILKKMVSNLLNPIRLSGTTTATNGDSNSTNGSFDIFSGAPISPSVSSSTMVKQLPRFTKINVIFEAHKGVDSVIGRSAHIRMLDQTWFMQMFVLLYKNTWSS